MQPEAFCAVGCPPQKLCPVADNNLGCVIGTERLHNPGQPRCCEVDNADIYLKTVRDILAYLNTPQNDHQNTANFRQALGIMLQRLNIGAGPSMFSNDTLFIDNSSNQAPDANFTPSQTDDLLKLLEKSNERTQVDLFVHDIVRQPIERREDKFDFYIEDPPENVPDLLCLADRMFVFFSNAEAHRMVSLVVHVLEGDSFAESGFYVGAYGAPVSRVTRNLIRYIRRAMHTTTFTGSIRLEGDNLLADNVEIGTDVVAPGKTIVTAARTLDVIIG
ncbi:unnamed protein product [Ectocarpus sp. 4 AP-2014]|uniref:EsV-1-167 n=1 Tax=Ectocarpus siliculosus virus 1 (isolate New Zealand/Kaikoura/1988) TaxID=654926 RepID=Q8QNB8_ESV1K|nr:EsV-1-167 [Ectocarpus siliculosus virus 1]AAK14581.1 EsV-1-167 [Ectocarpus siliculosus virus 1]